MDFYLASKSPRRAEILKQLGYQFEILVADIDEAPRDKELALDYVQRIASEKAYKVANLQGGQPRPVLAADTTVVLGDAILGKPTSPVEALNMLERLSGRSHIVHTAIALMYKTQQWTRVSSTQVYMDAVPQDWLQAYVESGEPMDKAGAYGIQGAASRFITRIDGSYSGVMGLPVYETTQLLLKAGVQPRWTLSSKAKADYT